MASAREFCRLTNYPISIFLTYSFDPLFFERVPWSDLSVGGSRRILVAADARQVSEAMRRCAGQTARLGSEYVLAETGSANVFHPKLIARLSEEGGRIWIGSGNLTYRGWGGNRELATSWAIGPAEDDKGVWLNEVLDIVAGMTASATFTDQVRKIRADVPWLRHQANVPSSGPILLGMPGRSLAQQLLQRWHGRRFNELRICTGSTDVDGAFLAWAHQSFGIKKATVCLSPARASFDAKRLAKLPLDVRIIVVPPEQYMHAKFYWFSGQGVSAAITGSANCSAAAWFGHNVELAVAYDEPKEAAFKSVLSLFKMKALRPDQALGSSVPKSDISLEAVTTPRLVSLRLRPAGNIEVLFDPPLAKNAEASLWISGKSGEVSISLLSHPRGWSGQLPSDFHVGVTTLFARAEGISDGTPFRTEDRWVDNEGLLERASRSPAMDQGLSALSRRKFSERDDQKILECIQNVAKQLLDTKRVIDSEEAVRSQIGAKVDRGGAEVVREAPAVDPAAMIRSLREINLKATVGIGHHHLHGGSLLGGVISMLFGQEESEAIDLTRESWGGEEHGQASSRTKPVPRVRPTNPDPPATVKPAVSSESLILFRTEIDNFIRELSKPMFAEACDSFRMVQALTFPLLLCVRGVEAGWLPKSQLSRVAKRVTDVMFNHSFGKERPLGLLALVRDRCRNEGLYEDFLSSIGDGTLWLVLLAALAIDATDPRQVLLPQAAALASVFYCQEMLTFTDPARLSALLDNLVIQNATARIMGRVETIAQHATALNAALSNSWSVLSKEQRADRTSSQPANSLLWNPKWGFSVTEDSPAETYRSGVINLQIASEDHEHIESAVRRVIEACI